MEANKGIVKLIDVQRNLKYFEWKDNFDDRDYDFIGDIYKEIFLAVEKKSDTLIHFITNFQGYDDYLTPIHVKISKFRNLKTLKINVCCLEVEEELTKSFYHDLEIFQTNNIDINLFNNLMKNSKGYLKKISINVYDGSEEDDLNLIRTIYENCPLVEYLSLEISPSKRNFFEFENLLKVCRKLKTISLYIIHRENNSEAAQLASGETLSKLFIRSASENLSEIKFENGTLKFSLRTLESFLNNWRGRTPLTIITSDYDYRKEAYNKIISKYKDDGVIKDFQCVPSRDLFEV